MPILIALATIAGGAMVWLWRGRRTADAVRDAADMGRDVIGAARQWNFKRRTGVHPVDAIEEVAVAQSALAVAFLELGTMPISEERDLLIGALRKRLGVSRSEAEELVTLGRWLVAQCGAPSAAIARLTRRLRRLGQPGVAEETAALIERVAPSEPTAAQADALSEIALRLGRG